MTEDSLIRALPDWVAFVRRDGVVLRQLGGRQLQLPGAMAVQGKSLTEPWSAEVGALLLQLLQRTLKDRKPAEATFQVDGRQYAARFIAQGRARALCVIGEAPQVTDPERRSDQRSGGSMERRAFVEQLRQQVANASLRESPLAICIIHIDGLEAIGRLFDFSLVDQVHTALLTRLPIADAAADTCRWQVGRLGDSVLAAVVEDYGDRESLRTLAQRLRASLAAPIAIGSATFTLTPSVGIAVLGSDATRSRALLEHAHSAMIEARRGENTRVSFYSDTLKLRSLLRADMERELREAIANDQLALRYAGRYRLADSQLLAVQAYLTWPHPLRGEVRAAAFLPIAESTGLATALSQVALQRLRCDLPKLRELGGAGLKFSFGPLRHHLASNALVNDVKGWLNSGEVAPQELEIRISEKVLSNLASPGTILRNLAQLGVANTIDEFGRGVTSLPRLARLPIHALQLDRTMVLAAAANDTARKAVRGAIAFAAALELVAIAPGVDNVAQCDLMQQLGCTEGLGDRFAPLALPEEAPALPRLFSERPR